MSNAAGEADLITTPESGESFKQSATATHWRGGKRIHMDPELHKAASAGNVALLEKVLGSKRENHVQPGPDETAIDVTSLASLEYGTSNLLSGVTHAGDTALHIATCFGHYEAAEWICDKERSLLKQGNDKAETPLHYAAQAGNLKLVTSFIQLAKHEGDDVIEYLLRKRNRDGETALYQAIHHCQVLDVVRKHFRSRNAKPAWEEKNTHEAVVKELLRANHDVMNCPSNQSMFQLASIPNNNSISPLYFAITQNSLSIVTSLIESLPAESASQAAYAGPDGRTALHAAAVRKKNEGFIQKVVDWKPELTKTTDNSGSTPLHYAVSAKNRDGVKLLLKTDRTSAYIADNLGLYPIHVAAKMGLKLLVADFFEQCPDSDELLDPEGKNFLHLAVEKRKVSVVRWVCERSQFVRAMNSQDNEGDTPMHSAVKACDVNIFALLLGSQKTRLCIKNRNGLTPLGVAITNRTVGFLNFQNPNIVIERTLKLIGCSPGTYRTDIFESEHNLLYNQETKEKQTEVLENMAKSIAIGSTLIASAAFAGSFTICTAYNTEANLGHTKPGLSLAFKAFLLMATYAFICAIAATALVVRAALPFSDPEYRIKYVVLGSNIVQEAINGFTVSFSLGVLVMMIIVSQWRLACLVCLSSVMLVFLKPYSLSNILVYRALMRYWGSSQIGTLIIWRIFLQNWYVIIVLLVLLVGRLSNADWVEQVVLTFIVGLLLRMIGLYLQRIGIGNIVTVIILVIVLSSGAYFVLFFHSHQHRI